ncbi:ADOP family duplicated permease [Acidicapsa dinghuensis]|uniref:ADOP family duplicated permease n=1 Tax=Acidicapsa dinghuensis TaxID=2218256 RepID=A0ABW1EIK2_9BACT|nr:ABC transporter permease [Acidicapsa dinghuensis]
MKFRKPGFERRKEELQEEIQAHLQMDVAARMERGATREEAEAASRREFGNAALVRDVTHGVWRWNQIERLLSDLRYILRVLRRSPAFSLAVILTLAVGIGAACAMFTVVDRVLLRHLPYENPQQLIQIRESTWNAAPWLDIQQWQDRARAVRSVAYYDYMSKTTTFLDTGAGTAHVRAPAVSGNLFPTLGVHPALGREFREDKKTGAVDLQDAHSVMLSDAVWHAAFGGDAAILGKTIRLSGESLTVIGVMPRGFAFPMNVDLPLVWRPLVLGSADQTRVHNQSPNYEVIARLQPGATLSQANAELKAIQIDVAKSYTNEDDREGVKSISAERYGDTLVDAQVKKALGALMAASALLWLIACVNVTSLMLVRATSRQREMAVRGALGASRVQIMQQLLIEGLLLSGCGSLLGLGLAAAMLKIFEHALVTQFKIFEHLTPNLPVLAVLLVFTIASAALIAIWPAIGAGRRPIEQALRQGAPQQGTGRVQQRMRQSLVMAEIAMSLTLLVGCGLLLKTIYALQHVPLGFHSEHIVVADMAVPSYRFAGQNMTTDLYLPLIDKVKHLPGVEAASLMSQVPMGNSLRMAFSLGRVGNSTDDIRRSNMRAEFRVVGPEMQQVFGFPMVRGRFFNEQDTTASQAVVLVNRAFVRDYFGDERDPQNILGVHLLSLDSKRQTVIVGVIADEHQVSAAAPPRPEVEVCLAQVTPETGFYKGAEGVAMDLAVRTDLKPEAILPALREAMRQANPDLADSKFTTMDQIVEDSYGSQRLAAELLEIFAGSALLLCVAGIYGLLAYLVSQRTREMGVRIALGAQRWNVMSLILRQATWMLASGLALGLALAWITSRGLRSFLYDVKPNDPWTMAAVTILLLASGLAAAYWPARKASRVDPMEALRAE